MKNDSSAAGAAPFEPVAETPPASQAAQKYLAEAARWHPFEAREMNSADAVAVCESLLATAAAASAMLGALKALNLAFYGIPFKATLEQKPALIAASEMARKAVAEAEAAGITPKE
jgi:hypothetical protein